MPPSDLRLCGVGHLRLYRSSKAQNPKLTVLVMGCGAAYLHSRINKVKEVDFSGYDVDAALEFLGKNSGSCLKKTPALPPITR